MLLKKNRADTKTIEEIFKKGLFFNTPSLTFRFIQTDKSTPPRVSFIAPKNIAKSAVKRNLLRRRGYSALRKVIKEFPLGLAGAFVFRKTEVSTPTLASEIKTILEKI